MPDVNWKPDSIKTRRYWRVPDFSLTAWGHRQSRMHRSLEARAVAHPDRASRCFSASRASACDVCRHLEYLLYLRSPFGGHEDQLRRRVNRTWVPRRWVSCT